MTTLKKKPAAALATPPDATGDHGFSLISRRKLLALYAAMLKCRMMRERIRRPSAGKRRAAFPGRGGEAIAAGIVIDLLRGDAICAPRGELAPRFLKGVPLRTIFGSVLTPRSAPGRRFDAVAAGDAGANVLPALETFADQFEVASRAARLGMRGKSMKVTVLFCGREEFTDHAWEQSLRSAAVARLPMLFVCHGRPQAKNLAQQAQRCGLPGITVDQEDVVAIYRVASEALAHARRGNGPTLIECKPWIVRTPSRRSRAGNAIRNMETYLAGKGLFKPKFKADVLSQFERELDEAAAKAGLHRKDFAKHSKGRV